MVVVLFLRVTLCPNNITSYTKHSHIGQDNKIKREKLVCFRTIVLKGSALLKLYKTDQFNFSLRIMTNSLIMYNVCNIGVDAKGYFILKMILITSIRSCQTHFVGFWLHNIVYRLICKLSFYYFEP